LPVVVLLHHSFILYFRRMSKLNIKSDPVKTVLVITVGFLVVYIIAKWQWALYTALIVGVLGVFSNYIAQKIDWVWMKLTWVLSLIVPNILLSTVFYLFLTPIALLSRIVGEKDQLRLKNNQESIFKNTNKKFDPKSFENPW